MHIYLGTIINAILFFLYQPFSRLWMCFFYSSITQKLPFFVTFFSSDDEDFELDEAKEEVSTDKWEGEDEDDNDVKVGKIKFIHSLIFINRRNIQAIPMLRVKQIILNNVQFCHGKL